MYLIKIGICIYHVLHNDRQLSSVDFRKMVRKLDCESCVRSSGVGDVPGRSLQVLAPGCMCENRGASVLVCLLLPSFKYRAAGQEQVVYSLVCVCVNYKQVDCSIYFKKYYLKKSIVKLSRVGLLGAFYFTFISYFLFCNQKNLEELRCKFQRASRPKKRRGPANCHRRGLQQMAYHPLDGKSIYSMGSHFCYYFVTMLIFGIYSMQQ